MSDSSTKSGGTKRAEKHPATLIGWLSRAVSIGILLALAFTLGMEMLLPYRPTEISVVPRWKEVRSISSGVVVPATIINRGTDPVRNLTIDFPGAADEGVDFVVPLLGPDEEIDIVIGFPSKPGRLDYTVKSYETP